MVFWDQWAFVPLWDKLYSGTLTFNDLIALHNEHRFLVIRVITLMLGSITHWNNVAEMIFSWVLICLICFVLYKIYTLSSGDSWSAAARFIPVTWLMFNLRQYENLTCGIQIVFYMLIFSFLLAVYLLQTSRGLDWRFYTAVFCGAVGTYSMANGLLIWIIGLLQLLCIRLAADAANKKVYARSLIVWAFATAIIYLLYFWGYDQSAAFSLGYDKSGALIIVQQPLIAV
ncbi:MAG: hypothetical protein NTZ34_06625, partial [Chloroflexi bacterium]|nr:hypothetical protein [Chloroflexota bacterium]